MKSVGKKWDFFISHASNNHPQAASLHDLLASHGEVFIDCCQDRQPLDNAWKDDVYHALVTTTVFVVLVGTGPYKNPYFQFEISTALDCQKRGSPPFLIPVRIGDEDGSWSTECDALNLNQLGWDRIIHILRNVLDEFRKAGKVEHSPEGLLDLSRAREYLLNVHTKGGPSAKASAMLTRAIHGDAFFPSDIFTYHSTYPLAQLARQLPSEQLAKAAKRILTETDDHERILHGAHLFGTMYVGSADRNAALNELHSYHEFLRSRRGKIKAWPMIERQILYTESQLGDSAAKSMFLKAQRTPDGKAFDIAFNYRYYDGDMSRIRERFEKWLREDRRPSDAFVSDLLENIYVDLRQAIEQNSPVLKILTPERWPVT